MKAKFTKNNTTKNYEIQLIYKGDGCYELDSDGISFPYDVSLNYIISYTSNMGISHNDTRTMTIEKGHSLSNSAEFKFSNGVTFDIITPTYYTKGTGTNSFITGISPWLTIGGVSQQSNSVTNITDFKAMSGDGYYIWKDNDGNTYSLYY